MRNAVLLVALLFALFLPAPIMAAETDYLVGDGDVLKITVYDHPDLTTIARVGSDGTILFPLVGQQEIRGLSVSHVAGKIAAALADGYIVNPQVSIFIEEFRSKKAIIMGQVKNPGLYELSGPTSLLELISKAGGLDKEAGDEITIHRETPSSEQVFTINLKDLLENGDASLDRPIMDGDNVFVTKAGIYYVTGEVNKPDVYKLEKGATVIKAISMAGGFSKLAAKGKVKVIRVVEGQERILEKVPMDEPVLPDDVIVVPESFF